MQYVINLLGSVKMAQQIIFSALTSNSDVRFLALLGSGGAPGDTLTPVLIKTEDLLHLLSGDVNCHLHDWQCCKANTGTTVKIQYERAERAQVYPHQLVWWQVRNEMTKNIFPKDENK